MSNHRGTEVNVYSISVSLLSMVIRSFKDRVCILGDKICCFRFQCRKNSNFISLFFISFDYYSAIDNGLMVDTTSIPEACQATRMCSVPSKPSNHAVATHAK